MAVPTGQRRAVMRARAVSGRSAGALARLNFHFATDALTGRRPTSPSSRPGNSSAAITTRWSVGSTSSGPWQLLAASRRRRIAFNGCQCRGDRKAAANVSDKGLFEDRIRFRHGIRGWTTVFG